MVECRVIQFQNELEQEEGESLVEGSRAQEIAIRQEVVR